MSPLQDVGFDGLPILHHGLEGGLAAECSLEVDEVRPFVG